MSIQPFTIADSGQRIAIPSDLLLPLGLMAAAALLANGEGDGAPQAGGAGGAGAATARAAGPAPSPAISGAAGPGAATGRNVPMVPTLGRHGCPTLPGTSSNWVAVSGPIGNVRILG